MTGNGPRPAIDQEAGFWGVSLRQTLNGGLTMIAISMCAGCVWCGTPFLFDGGCSRSVRGNSKT